MEYVFGWSVSDEVELTQPSDAVIVGAPLDKPGARPFVPDALLIVATAFVLKVHVADVVTSWVVASVTCQSRQRTASRQTRCSHSRA